MGVSGFLVQQFRQAPSKRRFVQSLALGNKGGNRSVTSRDGTTLSVRRSGTGDPMVLVHGTLDGMSAFAFVELGLADRYTVSTYDRRGRGGSGDAAEWSFDSEVEDLIAVLEDAGGRPHVVAHSFGAVVALKARAAGARIRSLSLYEPPVNGEAISAEHLESIRELLDAGKLDEAIRVMGGKLAGLTNSELAIALAIPPVRKVLRDGVRTAPREIEALQSMSWDELPLKATPTLFLSGGNTAVDVYPTPEQFELFVPGAESVVLDGQTHVAQTFDPHTFGAAVLAHTTAH